LEQERIN